jgi:hypothetical protein
MLQFLGFLLNWGLYGALCAQVCEWKTNVGLVNN